MIDNTSTIKKGDLLCFWNPENFNCIKTIEKKSTKSLPNIRDGKVQ
jgi:hypothetical protein